MRTQDVTPFVGIRLSKSYFQPLLETRPKNLGWVEVYSEPYFAGGPYFTSLKEISKDYPLSFHTVGLSLGSDKKVDKAHLQKLKDLITTFNPFLISEHLSWSASESAHLLNNVLPLPYTQESLARFVTNVGYTQHYLNRQILIENPATCLSFAIDEMSEPDFLNQLVGQTGCGILLDLNNLYIQSVNHEFDPYLYIDQLNLNAVQEIHVAGHRRRKFKNNYLLIDTHDQNICENVWKLYRYTLTKRGPCHTLIERDGNFPKFNAMMKEAWYAGALMQEVCSHAA